MEATVFRSFVDKKKNKKYGYGDIVLITKSDFERINSQSNGKPLLVEGRHDLGVPSICEPCQKAKEKTQETTGE